MRLVYYTDARYREDLSYWELRKLRGCTIERILDYTREGNNLRMSIRHRELYFVGNKYFIKQMEVVWFSYKNGKFFGSEPYLVFDRLPAELRPKILTELGLSWMADLHSGLMKFALKKMLFKSILLNNIYSQETLVKAIGRRIYRMSDFSWRVLRDYIVTEQDFSIFDLMCFTKNLNESMKCLIAIPMDYKNKEMMERRQLLHDMLRMAADENRIINFRWSPTRMAIEHKKQIERALALNMDEKSMESIYDEQFIQALEEPNVHLLHTEKEIFFEGATMHHCLYDVYFRRICSNEYIAFHLSAPEECTMGVRLRGGKAILDQIYLKYDKHVTEQTRVFADDYVHRHEQLMTNLLKKEAVQDDVPEGYEFPF